MKKHGISSKPFKKQGKYQVRYGREIKMRFFYILFTCFLSFIISLEFSEQFIYFLSFPLKQAYEWNDSTLPLGRGGSYQAHFIFTELTEAFFTRIQISLFITFYCFLFLFLYQVWLYLKPGLFDFEKRNFRLWSLLFFVLFLLSNFSLFYLILPMACQFFISLETGPPSSLMDLTELDVGLRENDIKEKISEGAVGHAVNSEEWQKRYSNQIFSNMEKETSQAGLEIRLEAKIYPYLIFIIKTIILSHVLFQMPIILLILLKIGLLDIDMLEKKRKIVYLSIILMSGLLSPPDVLSQFFFMGILSTFYEIFILSSLVDRSRQPFLFIDSKKSRPSSQGWK